MSEPMHLGLDNPAFDGRLRPSRERLLGNTRKYIKPRASAQYFDRQVRKNISGKPAPDVPTPIWARPLSKPDPTPQPAQNPEPEEIASAEVSHSALLLAGTAIAAVREPGMLAMPELPKLPAFPAAALKQYFIARKDWLAQNTLSLLKRLPDPRQLRDLPSAIKSIRYTKLQMALLGMAVVVFVLGVLVSFQGAVTNHNNTAKVSALSKKTDAQAGGGTTQNSSVPSTTKPSGSAYSNYVVAPDLPRYIKIPGLGVNARVMQVGVTNSGALGTPSNVYDTAWYTGSSKPGQPGAMLIDGHVSSWTAHGVFYGLKLLHPGDTMQVVRGDGQVFNYRVVKTQVYSDNNVDMQAAVRPITAGKPGLNLITCTGQVKPGTSEFNQRVIVFAEQI